VVLVGLSVMLEMVAIFVFLGWSMKFEMNGQNYLLGFELLKMCHLQLEDLIGHPLLEFFQVQGFW